MASYIEHLFCTGVLETSVEEASFTFLVPAYLFFVVPTGLQPTEPSHT